MKDTSAAGREVTTATALSTSGLLVSSNVARRDEPLQICQLAPKARWGENSTELDAHSDSETSSEPNLLVTSVLSENFNRYR